MFDPSTVTAEFQYQLAHLHDDRGRNNYYAVILLFVLLATIAVALRLLSRRRMKTSWASDDYTIVAALVRPLPHQSSSVAPL